MVSILFSGSVWQEITRVACAARNPANVAVAYLGRGGSRLLPLPTGSSLVVDAGENTIRSGQTSPTDLLALLRQGTRIYSFPGLHAKVYVFDRYAFVGSANVSRRSATQLVEAVIRINGARQIDEARNFVRSLCIHQLDDSALRQLQGIYRPPQFDTPGGNPSASRVLVMDLIGEQGPPREKQVQPPLRVWRQYFGFDPKTATTLPIFRLREATEQYGVATHQVILHHHNWTIEIAAAAPPRPAILQMNRIDVDSYEYLVSSPR